MLAREHDILQIEALYNGQVTLTELDAAVKTTGVKVKYPVQGKI